MALSVADVLAYVEENGVKFARLAFCNLYGVQKHIAIMASGLGDAFAHGVCVDTASVEGFVTDDDADILLFPDPATMSVLPWRSYDSGVVRFYCDIRRADGSPSPGDGRALLKKAVARAAALGLECQIGSEYEFYLFRADEEGDPTDIPQDHAGYCDIAPRDKGESVRREICLTLEEMGLWPESSHHERGPGQNEVVLHYCGALEAADALATLRAVTELIAARNGLVACFTPKPIRQRNGSCIHVNLSISREGVNLFRADGPCPEAESFLAGILTHLGDLTAFLNPTPESFLRFGDDIPDEIAWYHQNRNQVVRIPAARLGATHIELRSPDTMLSPYLSFALLLEAGLWGIGEKLPLTQDMPGEKAFPKNLAQAVARAQSSDLIRRVVPPQALEAYYKEKLAEHQAWELEG